MVAMLIIATACFTVASAVGAFVPFPLLAGISALFAAASAYFLGGEMARRALRRDYEALVAMQRHARDRGEWPA